MEQVERGDGQWLSDVEARDRGAGPPVQGHRGVSPRFTLLSLACCGLRPWTMRNSSCALAWPRRRIRESVETRSVNRSLGDQLRQQVEELHGSFPCSESTPEVLGRWRPQRSPRAQCLRLPGTPTPAIFELLHLYSNLIVRNPLIHVLLRIEPRCRAQCLSSRLRLVTFTSSSLAARIKLGDVGSRRACPRSHGCTYATAASPSGGRQRRAPIHRTRTRTRIRLHGPQHG